jgi:hypothetical protein
VDPGSAGTGIRGISVTLSPPIPITVGEKEYDLLFTSRDMIDLDRGLRNIGYPPFAVVMREPHAFESVAVISTLLYFALKVPGQPRRAIPQTKEGVDQAVEMVRQYTTGKPAVLIVELGNKIFEAMAAAEWYNLKQVKEADTSVPQGDDPSKNSEGLGS